MGPNTTLPKYKSATYTLAPISTSNITTTKLMRFHMESQLLTKPENWLTGN
jgi:hypothetical protein